MILHITLITHILIPSFNLFFFFFLLLSQELLLLKNNLLPTLVPSNLLPTSTLLLSNQQTRLNHLLLLYLPPLQLVVSNLPSYLPTNSPPNPKYLQKSQAFLHLFPKTFKMVNSLLILSPTIIIPLLLLLLPLLPLLPLIPTIPTLLLLSLSILLTCFGLDSRLLSSPKARPLRLQLSSQAYLTNLARRQSPTIPLHLLLV